MSRALRPAVPGDARPAERRGPPVRGRRLAVRFLARLREERRFFGPAELARPIALDCAAARRVPAAEPLAPPSSKSPLAQRRCPDDVRTVRDLALLGVESPLAESPIR